MRSATNLQKAKLLRRPHGTITSYDHTISFNGKFHETWWMTEGEIRSTRLTWREVLKLIKNGLFS